MWEIQIEGLLPKVFEDGGLDPSSSELWGRPLTFRRNESLLVESESGRGKSSLIAFLAGLRTDYIGSIRLQDKNGAEQTLSPTQLLRNHLGVMFQESRLFPELTAVENVLLKNNLSGYASEKDIRDMLWRLGLPDRLDTPCGILSLGQQQRVAFVRTLCQPMDFLLLDEPISHLDDINASIMCQMIKERQEQDGIGVLVTSVGRRLPYEYTQIVKL